MQAISMLELDPYNANDYHHMGDEFIDDSKLEVVLQEKVKIIFPITRQIKGQNIFLAKKGKQKYYDQ